MRTDDRERRRRVIATAVAGGRLSVITSPLPSATRALEFYAGDGSSIYGKLTTASGDGSAVSAWGDETAGYSVAQATGGNQPLYRKQVAALNNRSAVQFDGTDDYLSAVVGSAPAANLATCTVYAVIVNTSNGTAKLYDEERASSATPNFFLGADSATGAAFSMRNDAGGSKIINGGGTGFNNVATLITATRSGGTLTLYRDGTQVATDTDPGGTMTIDRMALGVRIFNSTNFFKGWMACVRVSNALDRATIEPLLKAHYGIA